MNEKAIIKIAAYAFVGLVAVPAAVGIVLNVGAGVVNLVQKTKQNREIKKALKEGTIVEIDVVYYKATVEEA